MPLVKRCIEPRHLCRGAVPDGVTSELECVTNSTLAAIIKQLGSLSRYAEDIFGDLFNEANSFYMRMNSLQERVDLLAVKVTQLDSTVEEVSLQDINMRKAFKSSTIQDQQVVSRTSVPNPVVEMYHRGDKPPPLNILSPYRDDKKDALKFYTDPSYFFMLWREKMLQATEDKRKEKKRQKEQQKQVEDPGREVKKVRKARNRRQEWNMMAYDKEFRPDTRLTPSPYHGMSSEGSLSPDNRSMASDMGEHSYPASPNHPSQPTSAPTPLMVPPPHPSPQTQSLDRGGYPRANPLWGGRRSTTNRITGAHPAPHPPPPTPREGHSTVHVSSPSRTTGLMAASHPPSRSTSSPSPSPSSPNHPLRPDCLRLYLLLPLPPPPSLLPPSPPGCGHHVPFLQSLPSSSRPLPTMSPPLSRPSRCPPPPPPPGLPPSHILSPAHAIGGSQGEAPPTRKGQIPMIPISDARSDLLAAIRRGIQLRKVQEQREQEAKREPVGNDVATILSRRIAVEYSESESDSGGEDNGEWSD
ncbi:wiskott-Aldrich syndrome protein family member 3-like isoform X2 [Oncorhynchus tshawytscha]|uniref:wiskott-Aldrich syndrome protein family member 3-like isoform X2 n=1 Tax=Oncorhynchus tshawytscha TaxID=74940 RepID=UPI001C3CCAAF|nr:wiskott-Aldrich syndrome protein family member 3-like isoform X2 [Oncorhynchus tshawytscha]